MFGDFLYLRTGKELGNLNRREPVSLFRGLRMAYALPPLPFRVFLHSYGTKFSDSEINSAIGLTVVRSDARSGSEMVDILVK